MFLIVMDVLDRKSTRGGFPMKKRPFAILALALVALLSFGGVAFADDDSDSDSDSDSDFDRRGPNLVEVAIAVNSDGPFAGQFDTLIAAVLAADPIVAETLTGKGQFTVFAPTDAAFAALGLTPANIAGVPQPVLTEILLYHVARGNRDSDDILDSRRIRTLQGKFLRQKGGFLFDTQKRPAELVFTDEPASNGVIHVIGAVVLPFSL
jgi:uncharacterized surface protein with fasciclin (FAS1) repeats